MELTILMPCLNEALTLARCIDKAQDFLARHHITGEVLIADNGSTDGSQDIARKHGARVVDVPVKGYGAALSHGIAAAQGRYVIMGDSDDSYDFSNLMPFVEKLREGNELVMGNRFKGGIAPGAMKPLHYYFGNPVLTFIGKLLFGSPCGDFHCGLRGFNRASIMSLGLCTTGMEFASEMVVKATLKKLRIAEVPTTLSKDGRDRPPHLQSWRDGWRHLRFLLMYSPRWLFFYPGLVLFFFGLGTMLFLMNGPVRIGDVEFDVHSLLLSGTATIIGAQVLLFAFLAQHYCMNYGLLPRTQRLKGFYLLFTLERMLVAGILITIAGMAGTVYSAMVWGELEFGTLAHYPLMRVMVPSAVAIVIGVQTAFGAFLASILELGGRRVP